jgi:uncharacterized phiE125 gp8 family phage protein
MSPPLFPEAAITAARDDAKAYLRIATASEDALIERFAASALTLGEAFTGTALIARDWTETLPPDRCWAPLAMAPVNAITAIDSVAPDGTTTALAPDLYAIDIDAVGQGWVRIVPPAPAERIAVSYNAGAAAGWADLAAPVAQGIVLLIAHLFDARSDDGAPPAAVSALWRPWRRVRLNGRAAR